MNSKEIIADKCYNGLYDNLPNKDVILAWLALHYDGVLGHPDDRMDPDCGYNGWRMIVAEQVLALTTPDTIKYPSFITNLKYALEQFETFHVNDDDSVYLDKIQEIRHFLEDMNKEGVEGVKKALAELILYHEGAPEDVFRPLCDAFEAFSWINQR